MQVGGSDGGVYEAAGIWGGASKASAMDGFLTELLSLARPRNLAGMVSAESSRRYFSNFRNNNCYCRSGICDEGLFGTQHCDFAFMKLVIYAHTTNNCGILETSILVVREASSEKKRFGIDDYLQDRFCSDPLAGSAACGGRSHFF